MTTSLAQGLLIVTATLLMLTVAFVAIRDATNPVERKS
jgi:hypothetical protein